VLGDVLVLEVATTRATVLAVTVLRLLGEADPM
jgi:hypothetical protein